MKSGFYIDWIFRYGHAYLKDFMKLPVPIDNYMKFRVHAILSCFLQYIVNMNLFNWDVANGIALLWDNTTASILNLECKTGSINIEHIML